MEFGYCTTFDHYLLLEKLGYDYIELAGREVVEYDKARLDEMAEVFRNGKVKCCGFNSAVPGNIPIVGEGYDRKISREYAKRLCAVGEKLGIRGIGIGSPASRRLPYGYDVGIADRQAEEFLRIFGEEAASCGITVFWEHLNPTEGNYGLTWNHGIELVKRVDLPNVKLVCDLFHIEINRESLRDLEQAPALISHVHMAQLKGIRRLGLCPEYKEQYRKFIRKLGSLGYDGVISIEAFAGSVEEEAARSIKLLQELCCQEYEERS
ncbi:sugar phosphate isomerase/epimerase [Lachnospiraceae bacterium 62-35]